MVTRVAVVVLAFSASLTLGACSQVEDAANDAANDVKSRATEAVASEVKKQVCSRVADGRVSADDKKYLEGLVSTAESAGVSDQVTAPLRDIAESGDQAPADAVAELRDACSTTPSP